MIFRTVGIGNQQTRQGLMSGTHWNIPHTIRRGTPTLIYTDYLPIVTVDGSYIFHNIQISRDIENPFLGRELLHNLSHTSFLYSWCNFYYLPLTTILKVPFIWDYNERSAGLCGNVNEERFRLPNGRRHDRSSTVNLDPYPFSSLSVLTSFFPANRIH